MPSLQLTKVGEPTPFEAFLRFELERRNWTPSFFAYRVGASRSTVSRWLNSKAIPNHESVAAIAQALGVDERAVTRSLPIESRQMEFQPSIDPDIKHFMQDFHYLPKDFQVMVKAILHPIYHRGLSKANPHHPRLSSYRSFR